MRRPPASPRRRRGSGSVSQRRDGRWSAEWPGPPKHGSTRRFSLSPAWVAMLQARYDAQRSRGLYVASDERGRPYNVNALRRDFHALTLAAGLPRMRVHDLRHFAASELVNSGVSVTRAAAVLGHSSPALTLGRYSHPSAGDEGAPAALMEWLLERD